MTGRKASTRTPPVETIDKVLTVFFHKLGYIYLKSLSRHASLLILTIILNKYVWSL